MRICLPPFRLMVFVVKPEFFHNSVDLEHTVLLCHQKERFHVVPPWNVYLFLHESVHMSFCKSNSFCNMCCFQNWLVSWTSVVQIMIPQSVPKCFNAYFQLEFPFYISSRQSWNFLRKLHITFFVRRRNSFLHKFLSFYVEI